MEVKSLEEGAFCVPHPHLYEALSGRVERFDLFMQIIRAPS